MGAEQGSAGIELGGHSDSVSSPLRMHAALPTTLSPSSAEPVVLSRLHRWLLTQLERFWPLAASMVLSCALCCLSLLRILAPHSAVTHAAAQAACMSGRLRRAGACTAWKALEMLWSGWPGTRAETSCWPGLKTSLHGCGMRLWAHACRHAAVLSLCAHMPCLEGRFCNHIDGHARKICCAAPKTTSIQT